MPLKVQNNKSQILDEAQNEKLSSLVGHRCSILSSAVAQLSSTDDVDQFVKCFNVACLIKDFNKRSYFIRVFDLDANKLFAEIDLLNICNYEEIDLLHHVIVGKTTTFRLYFKSKVESVPFYDKIHEILSKKRSKSTGSESTNVKVSLQGTLKISAPFNFVHITHVGWNEQLSKFETSNPQSDTAISPYQIVDRQFAVCKSRDEDAVTEKQDKGILYTNEEFSIYNKAEIVSIFNNEFMHKFGHFDKICIKSVALPPPPPLPR